MLVSGGNLYHHGKVLGLGDPITDVENWRNTTLSIHLQTGRILDVTPEDAERLRDQQKRKDIRAIGQRAIRDHARAKAASQAIYGQIEGLRTELEQAEKDLEKAEQLEFMAADKLTAMREQYGDDALGLETEPIMIENEIEVEESDAAEPYEPEPTADSSGFSALTADELRAKAIGAVGGFTRSSLVKNMADWWGIDVYDLKGTDGAALVPKGSKKDKVLSVAVAIFEARYRIAELVESLDLDKSKGPSAEALLAVSLDAVGAAVPADALSALESWKDSITVKIDEPKAEPEPEPEPEREPDTQVSDAEVGQQDLLSDIEG